MRSHRWVMGCVALACLTGPLACSGGDSFEARPDGGGAGAGGGSGGAGGSGTGGSSATGGTAGSSAAGGAGGTSAAGGAAGAGAAAGADAGPAECAQASECDAAFGAAACGTWACNGGRCQASATDCTDDDFDGYGTGSACQCAGLDCDDADDTVGDTSAGSCYTGAPATLGVGTCVAGTRACAAGVWSPCSGEVTPSGEACNGLDDDCNGTADDALGSFRCGLGACVATVAACTGGVVGTCTPLAAAGSDTTCDGLDDNCNGAVDEGCASCVPVAPTFGNDAVAAALNSPDLATPFATIQAAIDYAVAHPNGPQTVCVAAGADCTASAVFAEDLVMASGVSVLGSYQTGAAGAGWRGTPQVLGARCARATSLPAFRTQLAPRGGLGVSFPSGVQRPTTLDGFQIDRFAAGTTAAITVDGAHGVVLSNLMITANALGAVTDTQGVNAINGAEVLITGTRVEAGLASSSAIGVRSLVSRVTLIANCGSINAAGRCGQSGGPTPTSPGVRHGNGGSGATYGVYLESSPGSTIETTGIQMGNADQGAGVRIAGDATGVVLRGNNLFVFDGVTDSHGVWMEDCGDAAPWIVDNEMISGNGANASSRADGIRAIGACHPVIDSNVRIQGGGEGNAAYPNGVHCGANASNVPSRCAVLNNTLITGAQGGYPPVVTGVRCDGASCLRVAGNTITARGAVVGYGVFLERTGVMLDDNVIRGGCSATAYGVFSRDSYARVQNNRIFGYSSSDCSATVVGPSQTTGLAVEQTSGVNEIDVNANDIDGGGTAVACSGRGVSLAAGTPAPSAPSGVFRNNIIRSGACTTVRQGFEETAASTDPRVFEHNDLDPANAPLCLYLDEGASPLTSEASVNALTDMTVSGVVSVDPLFVSYPADPHLTAGSPCIGVGTAAGAPGHDMDGDPRDPSRPDIGADEH